MRKAIALMALGVLSCNKVPEDFVSVDYTVMGTQARVVIRSEHRALADSAFGVMLQVDSLMSKWKPNSEISRLNTGKTRKISPLTGKCLEKALDIARISNGAFDPTVEPLVNTWGFGPETDKSLPDTPQLRRALGLVGWDSVLIQGDTLVLGPARAFDLGGIAKGFALDLAKQRLLELGAKDFIVEIGGDLVVSGSKNGKAWQIGLRNPFDPNGLWGVILMDSGAICTSGGYERFFEANGKRYTHIVNPKTGMTVDNAASVSVIAKTGAEADGLATALFVLGPNRGLELAKQAGVEAMFIMPDSSVVKTPGFPDILEVQP